MDAIETPVEMVPPVVMAYGALGVLPFVAPPVAALLLPGLGAAALAAQAAYAALILSFLGGARWGLEVCRPQPRAIIITVAMLPTLAGLAVLMVPAGWRAAQLGGLALLLLVHFVWDARSPGLPRWYARLRLPLTVGAIAGLVAGAVIAG